MFFDFNLTQDDAFINHEEDVIYVSSKYNKRLTIVNVTSSQAPSELSQLSFSGQPEGKLVIDGTRGFQLITKKGQSVVVVIDLAALEAPLILTEITSSDWLMNIEANNNYIYAIDDQGLVIIDITAPKQTTSIALGFAGFMINDQIKLDGNILYTTNSHLLNVINISEPSNPVLVKSLALDNKATQVNQIGASALVIADKHLYINRYSDSYDGFCVSIFDITAQHNPVFIGEIQTVGNNWDLAVHNNKAYVLASQFKGSYSWSFEWYDSWLDVYDLSDKANPLRLGEHDVGNTPKLTVANDVIYTIGNPLNVHEQPLFSEQLTVGNLSLAENASSITVVNNTTFMAKESNVIAIVDVTNSAQPSQFSSMTTTGEVKTLQTRDNRLYAGIQNGEKGLELYDIVEPTTPKLLNKFGDSNNAVNSITFDNDIAYLSNISSHGLQLVNIDDKTAPVLLGSAGDSIIETVINGDVAISLQRLNFMKFNITNTGMPKIDYEMLSPIGSLSHLPVSLAAYNDNLYVVTNDLEYGGSCLLAVEFPHTDIPRSSYCAKSIAGRIHQQGTLLFVPWGSLGIKIFDISSGKIELKAQYYGENSITGVDVENGKMYVTDTEGLAIFDSTEHIISEQNYYTSSTSKTLNYQLNWQIDYPVKFKCFVTAGSCTISINEETKTAQATWALPDISGDYEISIVGGNNTFYNVHTDKVMAN